jgi:uncharacterized membrane protein YqiK
VKNLGASERLAVPAPLVTPVVLAVFRIWKILILLKRVWKYQRGNQNRILKKNRQYNGQKKKYKRTNRSSNTNPTKNRGWTQVLRKGRKFLLH